MSAPAQSTPRWHAPVGAALGAIAFLVFAFLMHAAVIGDTERRAQAHVSLIAAKGLAALVQAAPADASADSLDRAARLYLQSIDAANASARIVTLDDQGLLWSSDAADLAIGAAPRPLSAEEKAIYDRGRLLAQAAMVNAERGRAARLEETVSTVGGKSAASAPIKRDERVFGMAEIATTTQTKANAAGIWIWLGLGAVAFTVFAYWRGAQQFARWMVIIGLLALTAITAAWCASHLDHVQTQSERAIEESATHASSAAQSAMIALSWLGPTPSAAALDADSFGVAYATPRVALQHDMARAFLRSIWAAGLLSLALGAAFAFGGAQDLWRTIVAHRTAYLYLAPAFIGMIILSILPFLYGVALSFTDTTLLNQDSTFAQRFVGIDNYKDILTDFQFTTGAGEDRTIDYTNFYWTLGMTIAWTVANVAIGVSLGLALALILNIKGLRGVSIYRTLLILPWAIPNYITALTWKGVFHPQFGSANQIIQAAGGSPVAWFDSVWPSFWTGVITNGWLSFPFMMVVCLGALQSIDEDMYEAARIDGANGWQRFWHITLPSMMPALLPAIIVSIVWTFNMFNVIYLVSAGQPGGATEILITRAYKVAFEEYRYGYAAAYSVVIFAILLIYSAMQVRSSGLTKEAAR
jgi:arabinogalactan oligomer/maltooligosaccharide transport system permease protein